MLSSFNRGLVELEVQRWFGRSAAAARRALRVRAGGGSAALVTRLRPHPRSPTRGTPSVATCNSASSPRPRAGRRRCVERCWPVPACPPFRHWAVLADRLILSPGDSLSASISRGRSASAGRSALELYPTLASSAFMVAPAVRRSRPASPPRRSSARPLHLPHSIALRRVPASFHRDVLLHPLSWAKGLSSTAVPFQGVTTDHSTTLDGSRDSSGRLGAVSPPRPTTSCSTERGRMRR